jgi:ATP/maltotriose-dependent transcriptional regulator MalT
MVALADLALMAGHLHEAVRRNRDLLAQLGPRSQALRLVALGNLLEGLCLLGQWNEARMASRQFALEAPRLGFQFGMFAVYALGAICVQQGRVREAALLLAWGDARYAREQRDRGPNEERLRQLLRQRLASKVAASQWPDLLVRGADLPSWAVVALAVGEDLPCTSTWQHSSPLKRAVSAAARTRAPAAAGHSIAAD